MKTSRFLSIAMLLFCSLSLTAQEKATYPFVERDSTLYLDVHKPAIARADKAAVVAVFGGGFVVGTRDSKYQLALADSLTKRGFTVINIDYRLGLKNKDMVENNQSIFKLDDLFQYCANIATEDCAAAIAWICEHAQELDIDPSKIVLTGSSAGAITVLQLDYCRVNGLPEANALPEGWKPAAIIPYSGGIICSDGLKYKASPAPTMLMHGTKDKIVSYNKLGLPFNSKLYGSKKIHNTMNRKGFPHWFIRFEGIGHEVASWFPGSVDLFCGFVDQALAGRITSLDATMTDSKLQPTEWTNLTIWKLYKK